MATFTDSQITDLCEILETNSDFLGQHLTYVGSLITETDKTKILLKVTEWVTAGAKFTDIEPKERNFGAKIRADRQKTQIRKQLAALLYATDIFGGMTSGMSQGELVRL